MLNMNRCTSTAILVHLITIFLCLDIILSSDVIQVGSGSSGNSGDQLARGYPFWPPKEPGNGHPFWPTREPGNGHPFWPTREPGNGHPFWPTKEPAQPPSPHNHNFVWTGTPQLSIHTYDADQCSSSCFKNFHCQAYTYTNTAAFIPSCKLYYRLDFPRKYVNHTGVYYSGTHKKPYYADFGYCSDKRTVNKVNNWIIPNNLPGYSIYYDKNDFTKEVDVRKKDNNVLFDIRSHRYQKCLVRIELTEQANKVLAENDNNGLSVEDSSGDEWNPRQYFRIKIPGHWHYVEFYSINTPPDDEKSLQIIVPGKYPNNCNITRPPDSSYRLQFKYPINYCKGINPHMVKDVWYTPDP